jgi:hypothetical protein
METPCFATGPTMDTEPVAVEVDGDAVRFTLDDGRVLCFDRAELLAALTPSTAPWSSSSVFSDR